MIGEIRSLNPHVAICSLEAPRFGRYGRVVTDYDPSELHARMQRNISVPAAGTVYEAQAGFLADEGLKRELSRRFFGGLPVEAGYCAGHNSRLTAMEYHKCSEVLYCMDDLVMALGGRADIREESYPSASAEYFYVPGGTVVELYAGTLHYGPMEVAPEGFRFAVCLLEGTNTPLGFRPEGEENRLLVLKNKWLICHEDAADERASGAPAWIREENTEIRFPGKGR